MIGSELITFNKAGMKEALKKIGQSFEDEHSPYLHSPHFYFGEWLERFPVRFWHGTEGLSFHGKDWDIGLVNNKLWISKGVRLR